MRKLNPHVAQSYVFICILFALQCLRMCTVKPMGMRHGRAFALTPADQDQVSDTRPRITQTGLFKQRHHFVNPLLALGQIIDPGKQHAIHAHL